MTPQRHARARGSSLIEFALVFSVLFPLFYGTFQFGLGFYYYNELVNAVRAGARYAAYRTYNSPSATPSTDFQTAVANVVVYGDPAGGTAPLVPGLAVTHIKLTIGQVNSVPRTMTVSINDFPVNVLFATFRLKKPSATFPYIGVYAPV